MPTRDTRRQHSRDHLRYPNQPNWRRMADCRLPSAGYPSKWKATALVVARVARCSMANCLSYARALRGAACLLFFRHGKPSTDGLHLYMTGAFLGA